MRKLIMIVVCVMLASSGCAKPVAVRLESSVVCTVFPCYDLARALAPEGMSVSMLIKPGVEPHAYEPTPQDILLIQNADVFVYIGGENEMWVDRILSSMPEDKPKRVKLIDAVDALTETEEDGSVGIDEHIWTSPGNMAKMALALSGALDPKRERLGEYYKQLERLDQEYRDMVEGAKRRELVFGDRFPFRYLAEEYGLAAYAAFPNCTGETEPSARIVAELISRVKANKIPAVYKVDADSDAIAKSIAEAGGGAQVLTLFSCHNVTKDQLDAGETYLSLMRANLEALRKGLS